MKDCEKSVLQCSRQDSLTVEQLKLEARKDGRARIQGLEQFLKSQKTRHDRSDWLLAAGCWLLKHFHRIKLGALIRVSGEGAVLMRWP